MKSTRAPLEGLIIFEPRILADDRGYFFEVYHNERYAEYGIPPFVQDNHSYSKKGVLRGLHYQLPHSQGKLVGVTQGSVWDVAIDLRRASPTFGKWFGIQLDAESHRQMYIPPGFAHGYCVLSDSADFYYKCTDFYAPGSEHGIAWNDPDLNIQWPISNPVLSIKDTAYSPLNEIADEKLFA
jgi:dTDP-4-dehydrorhamnose 3,5-epimerase